VAPETNSRAESSGRSMMRGDVQDHWDDTAALQSAFLMDLGEGFRCGLSMYDKPT
jgi:hypothetical protein